MVVYEGTTKNKNQPHCITTHASLMHNCRIYEIATIFQWCFLCNSNAGKMIASISVKQRFALACIVQQRWPNILLVAGKCVNLVFAFAQKPLYVVFHCSKTKICMRLLLISNLTI